jgi:tetratricopeptide (TPR) repeat protein
MKWRFLPIIIICLAYLGFSPAGLSRSQGINVLLQISGDVNIKRLKWDRFQKANIGNLLSQDDRIQLSANASATILCSNKKKWQVNPGKVSSVSEGCPPGTPTLTRPNSRRSPSRAPNETIPYIISPRNTALLTNRPILRWNAVPGATRYRVRVQDASLTLDWQTETSSTQIEYPGKPALQPDSYYLLIVETDRGTSSEEEQGTDLCFTLLDAQKAESVQTEITQIKQHKFTQEAEGLALALLYQSYDLKAEAIELLEGLAKRESQTATVYLLLGDLYLQAGLSQQAKSPYLKALELAQQTADIERQAEAQVGLGEVDYGLDKTAEAVQWLKKAKASYLALGNELPQIQEIEQRINEMERKR